MAATNIRNIRDQRDVIVVGTPAAGCTLVADGAGNYNVQQLTYDQISGSIPALAITETFVVADQAAMLALTAQRGDVAIRTDLAKTFILSTDVPSNLADWIWMQAPASGVTSVAGKTGIVTLATSDLISGTLTQSRGGTGFSTYTTGDFLYASATDTLSKLAGNATATRKTLTMTAGTPQWTDFTAANLNDASTLAFTNVANIFAAGTITTNQPQTITQTWNNAAVQFHGLVLNITDSAKATTSTAISIQQAGVEKTRHHVGGGISTVGAVTLGSITAGSQALNISSGIIEMAQGSNGTLRIQPASPSILFYTTSSHGFRFGCNGVIPLAELTVAGSINLTPNADSTSSSTTVTGLSWTRTYTQTGGAGSIDLAINRTDTGLGGGQHDFINCKAGGVEKFRVSNTGNLVLAGNNIATNFFLSSNGSSGYLGAFEIAVTSSYQILWSSTSSALAAKDSGIKRSGTNEITISNGASGRGNIYCNFLKTDQMSVGAAASGLPEGFMGVKDSSGTTKYIPYYPLAQMTF